MKIRHSWFIGFVLIVSCAQKEVATTSATQAMTAAASYSNRAFGCWFMVSDGFGHNGYQAADYSCSSATPQTLPLFKSIDELRVALHSLGGMNIGTIDGYTNGGEKIRGLTADELRALR